MPVYFSLNTGFRRYDGALARNGPGDYVPATKGDRCKSLASKHWRKPALPRLSLLAHASP